MKVVSNQTRDSRRAKSWRAYLISVALTWLILEFVIKLYKVDLAIPFSYLPDSVFTLALAKGLLNKDWLPFLGPQGAHLGAPFGFNLSDLPDIADNNLAFLLMKFLSLFTGNYVKVYNGFFILTFFLITLASVYTLRRFRLSYPVAMVFSILFAFLPYHFQGYSVHISLISYALVPLMVLILTWIWSRKPIFFTRENGNYVPDFKNYKSIFSLAVLLVAGASAAYYNLFFCFLALVAGISASFYRKSLHHLWVSFILIAVLSGSALLNLAPYIAYRLDHGANTEILTRADMEAETPGLSLAQLLLPAEGHRLEPLAQLRAYYAATHTPRPHAAPLGIIGSIGLMLLLFRFLFRRDRSSSLFYKYGLLALTAVLFALSGGASLFAALFLSTELRGDHRISVFLAFLSLSAVAFLVNGYLRHLNHLLAGLGIAALLVVGLVDEIPTQHKLTYNYQARRDEFLADREFVQAIERITPSDAMIFQLPFIEFPGHAQVHAMEAYDPLKGYLHSDTLRWSAGAVRGRPASLWYQAIAEAPLEEMLMRLSLGGFSGICIDRNGYADRAADLEAKLTRALQKSPMASKNGRLSYFDLASYDERALKPGDARQANYLRQIALYPIQAIWGGDFYEPEINELTIFRRCGHAGKLTLINLSRMDRRLRLYLEIPPVRKEPYTVLIYSDEFFDLKRMDNRLEKFEQIINIPADSQLDVHFFSNAAPMRFPDDKALVFSIQNMEWEDISIPIRGWWGGDFSGLEEADGLRWRWCGSTGELMLTNPSNLHKTVRLSLEFRPVHPEPYEVIIQGKDFFDRVFVADPCETYERTVSLAPGENSAIYFSSRAEPLDTPSDPRPLVFALYNFDYDSVYSPNGLIVKRK